jgi:fibronectin type 3 domain-containing protein
LRRASAGIGILVVSCLFVGCGYKTNPRPASATIPGDVGLVDARVYPDRIALRWDVPMSNVDGSLLKNLSGFRVYRTTHEIGEDCEKCDEAKEFYANVDYQYPTGAVIREGEVEYSDQKVEPGNIYYYSISPYNLKGREGPVSQKVEVVFDESPPAPTGLTANQGSEGIVLRWTSPPRLAGIRSYRVYRASGADPKNMQPVGGTKWAETYFTDKDVEKEKTYYYEVRSLKMTKGISLESLPSETASAVMLASVWEPPESVNTAATSDGIRIYWQPVEIENEQTRYNVYRSEAGKLFEKINSVPLSNPWFVDRDVRKGKQYRYAVTAFPEGKEADESRKSASEALKYIP